MKVGILGCGGIAQKMATTLTGIVKQGKHDIIPYAAASRTLEKAQAFAEKNSFVKAYGSYEELVKDPEIDLIYVATPHSEHYENMKLCIDNGKNILCEKAFTANAKQAAEVLAYAKEKGVLVAEALWVRYMPSVKILKEIIDSGVIGDVTTVTANLYYDIDKKQRINDPALCGGALLDVGIYSLTFASLIFGDDYEAMSTACTKFETGVDKQSCITLVYPNGKMAICSSGTESISDRKGMIYGRDGFIIVENINNPESIAIYDKNYQLQRVVEVPEQITGYEYEVYACKEALEQGLLECPDCDHAQTLRIMKMMDEARAQMGIVYPFE